MKHRLFQRRFTEINKNTTSLVVQNSLITKRIQFPAVQRTIEFSSGSTSSLFSSESISNITQYHCSFNINSLNHRRLCVCPGFLCLRITPAILSLYLQLTLSSGRTVTQLLEILCAEGPVHMLSIHSQLHASAPDQCWLSYF